MFESAEIGHSIDKEAYDAEVPALREALLEAQYELKQQARFPVIVLINGIEGAGKGETVKLLNEWMDPRMIDVLTFDQQTDEELARPPAWRYWRALPPRGGWVCSSATGTARCCRGGCTGYSRMPCSTRPSWAPSGWSRCCAMKVH